MDVKSKKPIDVPDEVLWMHICQRHGIPIGLGTYNHIIDKYPEHFPEECERKRKWDSIPQEVKDAYFKESSDMRNELYKDVPNGGGIIAWLNNREEHQQWERAYNKIRPIEKEREKQLHDKHFGKYGI